MKDRRGIQALATLFLGVITAGCVGGLVWQVVINDASSAITTLGLLATSGVSGLLVLAGAKALGDKSNGSSETE